VAEAEPIEAVTADVSLEPQPAHDSNPAAREKIAASFPK
jgi:hypothetical protein